MMAGIKTVHVPYKGSGPGVLDLVSGRLEFMLNPMPEPVPFIKAGQAARARHLDGQADLGAARSAAGRRCGPGLRSPDLARPRRAGRNAAGNHQSPECRDDQGAQGPGIRTRMRGMGLEIYGTTPAAIRASSSRTRTRSGRRSSRRPAPGSTDHRHHVTGTGRHWPAQCAPAAAPALPCPVFTGRASQTTAISSRKMHRRHVEDVVGRQHVRLLVDQAVEHREALLPARVAVRLQVAPVPASMRIVGVIVLGELRVVQRRAVSQSVVAIDVPNAPAVIRTKLDKPGRGRNPLRRQARQGDRDSGMKKKPPPRPG